MSNSNNEPNNSIITLEQLWHHHSFAWVTIDGAIFNVLKNAVLFNKVPKPSVLPLTAKDRIDGYKIEQKDEPYIIELFDEVPKQAVWHRMRHGHPLSNIIVDLDTGQFSRLNTKIMHPVWRWKYWNFSFLIFWSMLFHIENEWLRRPDLIWNKLIKLLETIHPETEITNDFKNTYWAYLALYERILGIEHDEKKKFGCYTDNILNCPGLTLGERKERKVLFDETLDWIKNKLQNEIQRYASLYDSN